MLKTYYKYNEIRGYKIIMGEIDMDDSLDEYSVIEESDSEKSDDDCRQISGPKEAMQYTTEIVNSYNNVGDKWNSFEEKILVVIKNDNVKKNETRKKLYVQNLSHLSNLHARLCSALISYEKKATFFLWSIEYLELARQLRIPPKILNNIFERFANEVNFKNNDFEIKKDDDKKATNENFVCFCVVVYQILWDLYGNDGLKVENFERNIKDLFSDRNKCSGFLSLVGKLSVLDNFCTCCNEIDNIESNDRFDDRFVVFQKLMKRFSLKMVPDKANKKIKIEKLDPKKEKDKIDNASKNESLQSRIGIDEGSETKEKFGNTTQKDEYIESNKINRINPNSDNNKPPISTLKIFSLIGIIITFLVFLCFLLNAVLCFIPIINFLMSIIFTAVAFVLSLLQIFIAYKTDTIRLYKLCCCMTSDNKSLFNMRRDTRINGITLEKDKNNIEK